MCSPDGILEKDIHIVRLTEVLSDSPVSLAAGCKKMCSKSDTTCLEAFPRVNDNI